MPQALTQEFLLAQLADLRVYATSCADLARTLHSQSALDIASTYDDMARQVYKVLEGEEVLPGD